jgi:hypothetical protein
VKEVFSRLIWVTTGLVLAAGLYAMEPLPDDSLSEVHGAEGVQLTLRLRNNVDASGSPIGCTGLLNPCRMGIEFSGREGIWLMLKDYYGVIQLNDIRMEGARLPMTNTGFFEPLRFRNLLGQCLIKDCNPSSLPAIKVSYPLSRDPGLYEDMLLLVNIGRTALEFDTVSVTPVVPGYMRDDATGSVLGFRMADSAALNAPSRARFDGEVYVFGF